ncbi:MAG: C-terminal binding protein [Syntrophomonas sp.]
MITDLKVVIPQSDFDDFQREKQELAKIGAQLIIENCKNEDEIITQTCEADALLVEYCPITEKVIENLCHCQVIVRYGIGVDNIDLMAATRKGIPVVNVPDYGIDIVADHSMALLLAAARKIVQLNEVIKQGNWDYKISQPMYQLQGKKLGIFGFGRIGRLVADRARGFGLDIQVCDPFISAATVGKQGVNLVDFSTLVRTSDFISLHAPANDTNYHKFNLEVFKSMKRTAILINTSRGKLVDESALFTALQQGYISGAGLDVTETEPFPSGSPLVQLNNVVITPHVAWYTEESQVRLQTKAAQEVVRVLTGRMPLNLVNVELRDHLRSLGLKE